MKKYKLDLLAALLLCILPLLFFFPVVFGGRTLLPADNLFAFEPWRSLAAQYGVGVPHNELLSDLILENYPWKLFIVESLRDGHIPLWNPYLFAGLPFLAAGQHSALYPFSVLFYVMPLWRAYGLFSALQLALAGLCMYVFGRVLGLRRLAALIAGITYAFSAFFVVSVVFTMMIAAAAWLPLLLAIIEWIVQREESRWDGGEGVPALLSEPIPFVALGAGVLGVQLLAGHVEISAYVLLIMAFYAALRLAVLWWRVRRWRTVLRLGGWLAAMVALGIGLGAVQFIPLLEVSARNFRSGSASYRDVIGWAYPYRRLVAFLVPDFFGNPAVHRVWDVFTGQTVPLGLNAYGQPNPNGPFSTNWGIKNYVEGGSYLGLLPLLLAAIAILTQLRFTFYVSRPTQPCPEQSRRDAPRSTSPFTTPVWIFSALALLSLAFVFGTSLYALLYYGLPGFNQLHSPFRWIYPYTLSLAVLAGVGADRLIRTRTPALWAGDGQRPPLPIRWLVLQSKPSLITVIAGLAFWGGLATTAGLLLSRVFYARLSPLVDRVFWGLAKAPEAFPDSRTFYVYEFRNLLLFALLLTASAIVLRVSRCPIFLPRRLGGRPVWEVLAVAVLTLDLFAFGYVFNPKTDPRLLDVRPPVVDFLARDESLWRFTTFIAPGEKTFNANVGMYYGFHDVRGYDSIFPKQYADFMSLIEPQDELLYNRIAPLSDYPSLDSPLLDLLGVKYVLTTQTIPNPGYRLVYDGAVRVYQNLDALPRAFVVYDVKVVRPEEVAGQLKAIDPAETVVLATGNWQLATGNWKLESSNQRPATSDQQPATSIQYSINEVVIDVETEAPGVLVLADSYFPGWKAYIRPQGAGEKQETEVPIFRADGNFRAVPIPAGQHTVRFKYTPMSFKLGLYVSFMGGMIILLLVGFWGWGRFYRESEDDHTVRRVAKNTLAPMVASLLNKGIDFAFAMLMLRILAPERAGRYQFAVVFIGYFEILIFFGLGTLLTREVARDRDQSNRYFSNVIVLRVLLWLAATPLMAVALFLYARFGGLTGDTITAIILFAVALFFGNVAGALSNTFYAYEKMEYPAGISTVTSVIKVSLGTLVLLLTPWGFVGLAAVSVIANAATAAILFWLALRHCFRPRLEVDFGFQRRMLGTSFPLMINHLLATVFFRIDVLILKPFWGDAAVGLYGAAYKYIDGLNIIPAYFTMAIFPLMSRYADGARESLMRAYVLALRLLLIIALPIAVGTPFIARQLILILGGGDYLPDSMIALQLLIGFLPFSFVNSVTQYVLIAIDQQRFLTKAFVIGVTFNVVANLLFIPTYGYRAAAVITILSELALLIPFYYCVRKHLAPIPWLAIAWRPALAAAAMGGVLWLLRGRNALLLVATGAVVYGAGLIALRTFSQEDMELLDKLIPLERVRARLRSVLVFPPAKRPAG